MMTTSNLQLATIAIPDFGRCSSKNSVFDAMAECGKSLLNNLICDFLSIIHLSENDIAEDSFVDEAMLQLLADAKLKDAGIVEDIFNHFTESVELKRKFQNQLIHSEMNKLELSVKRLFDLIKRGLLTSEEFMKLLSSDMVMMGFPTAVDQLVATHRASAGGCDADGYCYERTIKRYQKPARIENVVDALATTFLAIATPPSKYHYQSDYLELADGFSPNDLACFFKELLSSNCVPEDLKAAQTRMNLLFFNPKEFNKYAEFRYGSDLEIALPKNMIGLSSEFMEDSYPKCIFTKAIVEVAGVLADYGLIKIKSQLCKLLDPCLDTTYASRLHSKDKGFKQCRYFDSEMQTLLELMITAYRPRL